MTTLTNVGEMPAASVDERAVREFLATYGPNGPAADPEESWAQEIEGWGEPGSADFAHGFEKFLYEVQWRRQGLVLTDQLGEPNVPALTPIMLDITTDSMGYADCFLVRVQLRSGAQICSGNEELRHLASGSGTEAALDALDTVASMASDAHRRFVQAAATLNGNESADAGPNCAVELPVGLLACPGCGSTQLTTIERIPGMCHGEITRDVAGEVCIDSGGQTDVDWDNQISVGVQCGDNNCPWIYHGQDWAAQLVAGQR